MENNLEKVTEDLKNKYPNLGIMKVELEDGKASIYLKPEQKVLAALEQGAVISRSPLSRQDLDLLTTKVTSADLSPQEAYSRSYGLYFSSDVYGSVINTLANFSMKGFENDVADPSIKYFYDSWVIDTNFMQVLEWIFLDLFRVGMVRTYKVIGKYEPQTSYLSVPGQVPKKVKAEFAAKKYRYSASHIPIRYTVLNPQNIIIEGSLLFDQQKVSLKPTQELKDLLKKKQSDLTPDEKEIVKLLPSDFKKAIESNKNIVLNPAMVGTVDYRKMPYERYARPRGIRSFEALEYKNKLRDADLSTLDGISNYILKITIGSDLFPVTDISELQRVAQLFDTPSKAFDVVWNHTLNIERIVSPEISSILGEAKYAQVNNDITAALAFPRMLLDGMGNISTASAQWVIKSVVEEINYARRQVERWIYNEYREIATAMKFDSFPKVRWDDTTLKDIILYMTIISQLVDRRMLSYKTALEELGFDFETEHTNMTNEFDEVLNGTFGIIGSPWQQAKSGGMFGGPSGQPTEPDNIQPTQKAPKGTPSAGRPKGQPAKPKQQDIEPKAKTPTPQKAAITLKEVLMHLSDDELEQLVTKIKEEKSKISGETDGTETREN